MHPFFLMYCQLSTVQRLEIRAMAGDNNMATTGMADEEIPVVYEISVFMERQQRPNGYVVYRFANGSDYSGYMEDGLPHGYGVLRQAVITYIGNWQYGVFAQGIMIDVVRGTRFDIPWVPPSPVSEGPRDPQ